MYRFGKGALYNGKGTVKCTPDREGEGVCTGAGCGCVWLSWARCSGRRGSGVLCGGEP